MQLLAIWCLWLVLMNAIQRKMAGIFKHCKNCTSTLQKKNVNESSNTKGKKNWENRACDRAWGHSLYLTDTISIHQAVLQWLAKRYSDVPLSKQNAWNFMENIVWLILYSGWFQEFIKVSSPISNFEKFFKVFSPIPIFRYSSPIFFLPGFYYMLLVYWKIINFTGFGNWICPFGNWLRPNSGMDYWNGIFLVFTHFWVVLLTPISKRTL